MAQVAKGEDTRGVWTAEDGNVLVGVDASGLELRMLAHYMNDPDYIEEVLYGDIHWTNTLALGLVPAGTVRDSHNAEHEAARDKAKTFIYAFLYGAGDAKIGSIVGGGSAAGKRLKEQFLDNTPALLELREKIGRMAKQGHIPALDGRRLRIRHPHAALNTLLQGGGAIVMKRCLCYGSQHLDDLNVWYMTVAQVHDEIQTETRRRYAEAVGNAYINGLRKAGEHYDMRIPLDGEAMIGKTWAETH